MINRILAIAALLLFCLTAATAEAATAISYSEVDNTYGWCAGSSTSEAPGCAAEWCEKSNGADCRLALVCDAGWNALAFADSDEATGFGASCDLGSSYNARITALATCIVQSRTVCWTDSTFDGDGDERSKTDNGEFDITWYVQGLLKGLDYDPGSTDGAFGNRTRTAIRAFQADIGLEQTGEATEELLYILLAKTGGVAYLVASMEALVESFTADEKSRIFSAARAPLADPTFSDELRMRTTAVQRILLADYLRFNDRDCPVPASRVALSDATNGIWTVTCSNGGSYTVTLSADGKNDLIADNNKSPEVEPPVEPEATVAGIAFAHSLPSDSWGMCTGTVTEAAECAVATCVTEGSGTACETVLTCEEGGWSAAAISPGAYRGMGFACGYASAYAAREVALAECLHETRSICGLAITVDPQSTIMSKEDDAEFTRIYTTQAMLSGMGFYADALSGEENQSTRDAVTKLQTELGLEPTGTIDDDLYELASYGGLGTARYVAMMSRHIYDTLDPAAAAHHYGKSARPAEELGFREELGTLPPDERVRAAAAAISAIDGGFCTMPAMSAELDGDKWIVDCAEGKFALTVTGYDVSVAPIDDAPTPPPSPPPGKDKSPSPRGKDKG